MSDPTRRFTGRVADYVRYRPGYPEALLSRLQNAAGLTDASEIADLGSGTGISTEMLLRVGGTVYAIEPNEAMRAAAEDRLGGHSRFRSVNGTAEQTTLPDASVDLVASGQAFHWFRPEPTRTELVRILRPAGLVALFWNRRRNETPFGAAYEALLRRHCTDYERVDHRNVDDQAIARVLAPGLKRYAFENVQVLDLESLTGRVMSASYAPPAGQPSHQPLITDLADLFTEHQRAGVVRMEYETALYLGRVRAPAALPSRQ